MTLSWNKCAPGVGLLLLLAFSYTWASDLNRERLYSVEILDSLVVGAPIFLDSNQGKFLALLTEAERDPPKGAVLILHGRGLHPNWPTVTGPLRRGLAERGWLTLAIQLPVLPRNERYAQFVKIMPDAIPRIENAIRYLQHLGFEQVHLVAHSCGAQMTMRWFETGGGQGVKSLTLVSMGSSKYHRHFGHPVPLDQIQIPIHDIFGEHDIVSQHSADRLTLIEIAGHAASQQSVIPQANHYYQRQSEALVEQVAAWLTSIDL